ncbi:MAG: HTH domain-containing protein [Erysipelotrichaceae bacterium]|nr:HTH domain-containing protein [Erysipelotrichaceae bacterium]
MKIEKNRHIIIFKTLIEGNDPVTAETLAKLTKSSLRTIKNDIAHLDSQCVKEEILHIRSFKAKGYAIEILDEKNYEEFVHDITVLSSLFYGRNVESVNRRLYILQRFLVDEYVKIEDLCDELFLSRSSIRKDITWASRFLASYHISLESVVGKGYHIYGKEQDLRSALVELRCSQYHEFQPLYPYEPFDELFRKDGINFYAPLRKAFLDILRSSRIVVSDIETKKIASHICLMYKRIKEGKHPSLTDEIIEELKQTYDYEVAKQIFADETIRGYVNPDEIEILNFARILLINRELNLRITGSEDLPEKLVKENHRIFEQIIDATIDPSHYSIASSLHKTDMFKLYSKDLESLQLQLYLKHHFDYTGKMRFVTYQEGTDELISPIPLELTRVMIARLQLLLGARISDAVVQAYAGVYERLLKKVVYPYKKLRLAVSTTDGLVYSQHVAESLSELYGSYIEKVDVFNLYEMRKVNFDDYDALVYSGAILYYSYPLPIVAYQELDYNRQGGDIFNRLFINGFDRSELYRIRELLNIYENERVREIESFVEALSYRYARDPYTQKILYDQYVENEEIINHYYARNGIMIIFFPYRFTMKEIIDIYIPDQSLYYRESMEVNAIIAVCVDPRMRLADLKILDHVLRYIVQVPDTIEKLIEDKGNTLDVIFDAIVRRKFLNT